MAAGLENPYKEMDHNFCDEQPDSYVPIVREIINSDKNLSEICDIRRKLILWPETIKTYPVISPLCLLELMEYDAEQSFRQIAAEAGVSRFLQNKRKKEIGDYLKKVLIKRKEEIIQKRKKHESHSNTPLAKLMNDLADMPNLEAGLKGLCPVDIVNFNLGSQDVFSVPSYYTWLQLGAADILHVLFAEHLGCKYLASRDSDFERVKDRIENETGIIVLTKYDQIIDVL